MITATIKAIAVPQTAAYLDDPDVQRMLRLRSGDLRAFDEIVEGHRRRLIRLLYGITHDAASAEELAQEVLLRVYRARERYEPTASFNTWLYRIATNRARNWLRDRSEQHWREESLEAPQRDDRPRQWVDPAQSIEDWLLREDAEIRLRRLVEELPDRQRSAVLLHKFRDLSYQEIAALLDCSIPALKSILFRAYGTLRARLSGEMMQNEKGALACRNEAISS